MIGPQMTSRALSLAGFAAALLLALPGCHRATPGEAANGAPARAEPRSLAALLDYSAGETARIVAAADDRPARLDRMLVAIGQPNPNMLWTARLRTSQPFECRTQTTTMVRCFAQLSWIGQDTVAGYANVMIYDHDITLADLLVDRDRFDPPETGQTVHTTTEPMYLPADDGSNSGPYSTCRQALGADGNGAATCFSLIGARTALWARLQPDSPSYAADGSPNIDVRPNIVVTALDYMIMQLRTLAIAPDGSFSIYTLPVQGPLAAYDGPGWYARTREVFVKDSLYAGPYGDEAGCQSDLPRAALAYAQFQRSINATVEGCQYYASPPAGL
jgi:hypothetical protein